MIDGIAYIKAKLPLDGDSVFLSGAQAPIVLDLANGLCVTYVEDKGDAFRYLTASDLHKAGVEQEAFHAQCVENLAKIARAKLEVRPYGNIFAMTMGGNFEASLILIDQLWDKALPHTAPNGFIAALPARDILAYCDARSEAGREELHQLIGRLQTSPGADHLLLPLLFRRVGQRWERLLD